MEEEYLTAAEAVHKLATACEDCDHEDACCALVGLKKAGYSIELTDFHDSGFTIKVLKK